jgi:adenylate cyclase
MQTIDEGLLTQALLDLFQQQGLAPGADHIALEEKIRLAIAHSGHIAHASESRRVTILLSDLRGFTATTERHSAIAMVEALNRYLEKMSEIILRHGGSIDKFMGDSIMALFGAPEPLHNDIEAALRCAIQMQVAMEEINAVNQALGMAPLFMGIGINTGEVIAGHLGSHYHSEYTVIGDEVNLASRVEAHSLRGQILLSEKVYTKANGFINIGQINEVFVKGKKSVVRMFELLGVTSAPAVQVPAGDIRIGPRVEVDMPLNFQLIEGKSVLPDKIFGRIVDISYGGMYIQSQAELPLFCDVKMKLALSLLAQEQADVYGKVLRMTAVADGFEYRIEFTSIDVQAQRALKEFVDRLVEIK